MASERCGNLKKRALVVNVSLVLMHSVIVNGHQLLWDAHIVLFRFSFYAFVTLDSAFFSFLGCLDRGQQS